MQNCYVTSDRSGRNSQDERLTKKHIETLTFVKELGLENKQLRVRIEELESERLKCKEIHVFAEESKERLTKLHEQFLKRTDEVTAMMAQKHQTEMLKLSNEKLDMEQRLQEELDGLKLDIGKLQGQNTQLQHELSIKSQDDETEYLRQELANAKSELDILRSESINTEEENATSATNIEQIERVKDMNTALSRELTEANQKNRELKFRLSKVERDLEDSLKDKVDQELVETLKNRLTKLHSEKVSFTERETEYNTLVNKLYGEIQCLKQNLGKCEEDRHKLKADCTSLMSDIIILKRQLRVFEDKQNFKEFVALKREMGCLKEENDNLRKKSIEKKTSLPLLKGCVDPSGSKKGLAKSSSKLI